MNRRVNLYRWPILAGTLLPFLAATPAQAFWPHPWIYPWPPIVYPCAIPPYVPWYGGGYSAIYSEPWPAPATPVNTASAEMTEAVRASANLLSGYGIANHDGRIDWPVGLRVVGPAAITDPLRQHLESLVWTIADRRTRHEKIDASLIKDTERTITAMRRHLADHATDIALTSYQDATRFLQQLWAAVANVR